MTEDYSKGFAEWRKEGTCLPKPLPIEHGMATVDGVLGTGVAWGEQAVERSLA